ncbi:MAG: hypothetical protein ACRDZN_03050 [Acidimicrobiales bacterium]
MKFELLADLDDVASGATVAFDGCEQLGAVNLRGTGFASRDVVVRALRARVAGVDHELNVAGLAGFLLAKCAAARRAPWTGPTSASCSGTTTPAAPRRQRGR